jgi:hypothetical protein
MHVRGEKSVQSISETVDFIEIGCNTFNPLALGLNI